MNHCENDRFDYLHLEKDTGDGQSDNDNSDGADDNEADDSTILVDVYDQIDTDSTDEMHSEGDADVGNGPPVSSVTQPPFSLSLTHLAELQRSSPPSFSHVKDATFQAFLDRFNAWMDVTERFSAWAELLEGGGGHGDGYNHAHVQCDSNSNSGNIDIPISCAADQPNEIDRTSNRNSDGSREDASADITAIQAFIDELNGDRLAMENGEGDEDDEECGDDEDDYCGRFAGDWPSGFDDDDAGEEFDDEFYACLATMI